MNAAAVVTDLLSALPEGTVDTDPATLARCSHDDAEWAEFGIPAAVVFATSTEDVVQTVRIAARHGVSVVPRGAGTGLSGGANATAGCLVLSLERMTEILRVDVDERYAVVQAGVLNDDLRRHVAEVGLWYPPDPASQSISTIGGNVATNAGGICCVKYGVTRDYVLALTVILADGRIARVGRTTAKGVTGYDLTSLFAGSEGTLGIVVEVTVKLLPLGGREAACPAVAHGEHVMTGGDGSAGKGHGSATSRERGCGERARAPEHRDPAGGRSCRGRRIHPDLDRPGVPVGAARWCRRDE